MEKIASGKVREIYKVNDKELVIVTTDRVSAFDVIMPTPVPNKGKALNGISSFWFNFTKDIVPNHMISEKLSDMPEEFHSEEYEGRTILVKKLNMIKYEFIVRGYMFGSIWSGYQKDGSFCGLKLRDGYKLAEKLDTPLFTPSTKAEEGHDINVSVDYVANDIGKELTDKIYRTALEIYTRCAEYAATKGIIIADTKFEFGLDEDGNLVLADEVLTPDSSRFWNAETYEVGTSPESYDKQFLRDWLTDNNYKGVIPAPEIPADIIAKTSEKYQTCYKLIVG